ncbi:hypothetical protein [Acuticoccus sp. I52.16.1]|uniref:hypothetical protein n=1 Tax=Acuticoccus sp. I52.16.1 TaxID=2928472 RepID=UPI001FD5E52E|nr:hypothetical protein [Acuticoccus sp. I52.16.1]UOM32882.1 hypothetical protein MRB58_13465 [Acuticoccus sp. I52.16.1]
MEPVKTADATSRASRLRRDLVVGELPYLAILVVTLAGVAYAAMTDTPMRVFWELVAVFNCAAAIFAGWHYARDKKARWRLVWTQLLHWAAFIAVMSVIFLPSVQAIEDADTTSFLMMLLLALGTFVAGVHTMSWRLALNGVVIALFVPAMAWLDQSALLLSILGIVLVVVAAFVVIRVRSR